MSFTQNEVGSSVSAVLLQSYIWGGSAVWSSIYQDATPPKIVGAPKNRSYLRSAYLAILCVSYWIMTQYGSILTVRASR